jgi:hypothetical protein
MVPQHKLPVLCILLACLAASPVGAQEPARNLSLQSAVLTPAVPWPGVARGVFVFQLTARLDGKGGGKGELLLDPNARTFDDFGAVTGATTLAPVQLPCSLRFVKKGKVRLGPNPPRDEERFVYEVRGEKVPAGVTLVTAAGPAGTAAWLLVREKDAPANVIRMYPPDISPCHPGCFPAGTLVQTPRGPRPIDALRAGDEVTTVGADGRAGSGRVRAVSVTRNRLVAVATEAGVLLTTQTQPLCLAAGGLRAAGELKAGDVVFRWQGGRRRPVRVRGVRLTDREEEVFNLVLGGSELFIAGGFLARSKPPAGAVLSARGASPAPLRPCR